MAVTVILNINHNHHHHPFPSIFFTLPPSSSSPFRHHQTHLSKLKKHITLSSSSSSPPNQNPSSSIFLPFLEQQQQNNSQSQIKDDLITDPLHKFFKTQTSSPHPDPPREGKFTLQKNRRSSWHLSVSEYETLDTDVTQVTGPGNEFEQSGGDMNEGGSRSDNVKEIIELAKNLQDNVILGEVLGKYEGRLSGRECVEVLGLMGEEDGLVMCCLWFFEWMSLQEPSLVTPWAYSALFPVLGRAGMGDKLMILFDNLPDEMEFKQVHVYNSAISALSCCGRY